MKTQQEIQRAHDLLVPILLGDVEPPFDATHMQHFHAAADVLCWVLEHEHNQAFGKNIAAIEAAMKARGLNLIDHGN